MATNTLSNRGYRSSMQPEQLESRVMLSASPSNVEDAAAVYATQGFKQGDGRFELQITGKEVGFVGPLPAWMTGTISYVMANGTVLDNIGTYSETLTPILTDITGDGVPEFVGTNGVSTLSFFAGKLRDIAVGTITTVNTSYIEGVTAAGELLVGSTGTIAGCSGIFKQLTGTFTSKSTVSLAPVFTMSTNVYFVVQNCKLDLGNLAKVTKSIVNELAENHLAKLKAKAIEAFHAGHDHDGKHSGHVEKVVKHISDHGNSLRGGRLDRWASDLATHLRGAA